jgi:DNA-binding MarR family transcriptional regulator
MTCATGPSAAHDAVDPHTADPCSSDELARAWKTVVRGYTHVTDLLTGQVERETGLPAPAFFALVWLLRDGSGSAVPMSMLARQVAFSSGGFTKVADRLEQASLIERQPSASDRRVTHAVLTEEGRVLAERAFAIYCAGLRELVVERLGLDGLHVLADHMSRLSGDADAVRGSDPPGP